MKALKQWFGLGPYDDYDGYQHVGTYWWGWQVRGNAEKGIVVSDYKVGVK